MRVFLLGIDGLTFRILHPMIERGLLPNFQKLSYQGVEGILKSTTPPMTPPAWMSISTGLSAAKHGVYDFWRYEQTEDGPRAHVMTHREGGKAIWNVLSEWGKRVIVANVPMTYPPEPVNGIMLSGYMAPDMKANVTYPTDFQEELMRIVPNYQIDLNPAVSGGQIGDPLTETLEMTRGRIAMLRLLLDKPWDFFFVVFTGADRIQHLRWDDIMAFHPLAVAYYQMLDEVLGMVLATLDDQDLLMVVSDHGFQGARRRFYIHEYLRRSKLLRLRNRNTHQRALLQGFARELIRSTGLRSLARLIRYHLRQSGALAVVKEHHAANLPDLDWSNTQAWIPSTSGAIAGYADILLDASMTEEKISKLIMDLQKINDPETGQPLAVEIHREDVFGKGPFVPPERHLILISGKNTTLQLEFGLRALWNTCDVSSGIHHPDGVLYLYGAGVKRGVTIAPTHVYDVVPTILSYMELALPKELDGRVIEEAFERPLTSTGMQGESKVMLKLRKLAVD